MPDMLRPLWLLPLAREGGTRRIALLGTRMQRIGRSPANDVRIDHPAVSREHAVIEWGESAIGPAWRVTDQGSASGTWVNDVPLPAGNPMPIRAGDRVRFGPVAFEAAAGVPAEASTDATRCDRLPEVHAVDAAGIEARHLDAVLAAGAAIHAALDDASIARAAVDAVVRASGFRDVAFVRAESPGGPIDVLAHASSDGRVPDVSRAMLARARGEAITYEAGSGIDPSNTMVLHRMARVICVPVVLGDRSFGHLWMSDPRTDGARVGPVAAVARAIASTAALALANLDRLRTTERLEAEHRAMFDGTMQALIASIDAKDPYTRGHSARVSEFAFLVASRAGLPAADCERARLCGLVHDIGKIGVSEDVLRKPGRLTEDEFRQIATHPVVGHEILRGIPQMWDVLPGVLHHHERFDGRGYPHGLSGDRIPLVGRVVAVADAIDAMTTSRTYRGARPMAEAVAEVVRCAGTHFDPGLAVAVGAMDRRELQAIVGLHVFGPGLPGRDGFVGASPVPESARPVTGIDQAGPMRRTA
jgi:hypothetical protein